MKKKKFEKPELFYLDSKKRTVTGECLTSGSGDGALCTDWGNAAVGNCDEGQTATDRCVSFGVAAVALCLPIGIGR